MFVRLGYNGVSFLAIGKEVGIGHSAIHYYFRTKEDLAEYVLANYCQDTLEHYRTVWKDEALGLTDKCLAIRDWIYRRYVKYNPGGRGGKVWGLLTRFSIDADQLSPNIKILIRETEGQIEALVREGVEIAVRKGELRADAPVHEISIQIATLLQLSMQLTRYAGSFQRFDDLLRWTCRVVQQSYGEPHVTSDWRPPDFLMLLGEGEKGEG